MRTKSGGLPGMFVLIVLLSPLAAHSAEFEYSYLLPTVENIAFTEDSIVLETSGIFYVPMPFEKTAFLLDRENRSARQIEQAKADEITEGHRLIPTNIRSRHDNHTWSTADGTPYRIRQVFCIDKLRKSDTAAINFNSREMEIEMNGCSSFSSIETTEEYIWLGTYDHGSHGAVASEGLLVIDRETGQQVSKIEMGTTPILAVTRDPMTGDIWAFGDDQIVVVSDDLRHQHKLQYYYDFDNETGEPTMQLAVGTNDSNPMSFVSMDLPSERRLEFYKAIESLPNSTLANFSIESYFFCCFSNELLPKEFNVLLPFIPVGYEYTSEINRVPFSRWQKLACRLDHTNAQELCKADQSAY